MSNPPQPLSPLHNPTLTVTNINPAPLGDSQVAVYSHQRPTPSDVRRSKDLRIIKLESFFHIVFSEDKDGVPQTV